MNKRILLTLTILILLASTFTSAHTRIAQARAGEFAVANVGGQAVRQSIVYKPPAVSGTLMVMSSVASHFEMLIYARSPMLSNLNTYKQAGWNGLSLLYFDISKNNGASGLSSKSAQVVLCTSTQKSHAVYTNTITMDTGELCRIHDAAISGGQVDGLVVTENWFLHKSDGSRYEISGGGNSGSSQYRMNLANANYQQYVVKKLRREFSAIDSAHLPTGAQGLFLDNISESWNDILNLNGGQPPKELADKTVYLQSMASFLTSIRTAYPSIQIWGNMTSFSTNVDNFTTFKPLLDGAMIEGAFLNWTGTPRAALDVESSNATADQWGKPLLYVVQGDKAATYHSYTFGLYLLMANNDAYFFFNDRSSYADYYELPEYQLALGSPLSPRQKISTGVWSRQFENGFVQVDMNTHISTITLTSGATATNTSIASPTHTPTVANTATKTFTSVPSFTPTRTATPVSTSTKTLTPQTTSTAVASPTRTEITANTATKTSTATPTSTNTPIPSATLPAYTLTTGLYQESFSSFVYNGAWTTLTNSKLSGGSLRYSQLVTDSVSFNFMGSGFSLLYFSNANQGVLSIYVDGALIANLNQSSASPVWRNTWTSPTFTNGTHGVTFKHSSGGVVTLDAIQIQ